MNPYFLKRKNENIAIMNLTDDGLVLDYKLINVNDSRLPIHNPQDHNWFRGWWSRRAVPINQGQVRKMLEKKGLLSPEDYLVKNLGLSLIDYYWISPMDKELRWEDVNLFDNDFGGDIDISDAHFDSSADIHHYTPNASLQGSLEKSWIILNGKRGLLKGNHDAYSAECINEVIASRLHEMQGYDNYLSYRLVEIHDRPYQYGCFSELFTSQQLESVTAYDIEISEKRHTDVNTYEHFINVCSEYGLCEEKLRPFLEYQIMTDFILSNRDRHLSNISILRNAETLDFIMPAPIYDSGRSLFVADTVPSNDKDMLTIQTESFASTELKLLSYVTNKGLVDVSKLPDPEFIRDLYSKDKNMNESRIKDIVSGYKRKVKLFSRWQNGDNLEAIW